MCAVCPRMHTFWAPLTRFLINVLMFLCDLVERLVDHGLFGGRTWLDSCVLEFVEATLAVRKTKVSRPCVI
eukprot:SAG31_NODE_4816_length_2936_cov_1.416990_3_plen_71_part_00